MTEPDSHHLISAYLERPWHVRLGFFMLKAIAAVVVIVAAGWYLWRITPPETQKVWRAQYPILERTAAFLEQQNLIPSTAEQLAIKEHNAIVEAKQEVERKTPTEDKVWDLRDQQVVAEANKLQKKDLTVYEPEKTYEIRRRDMDGNVFIEKVTESEYREILRKQQNDEPVMDIRIGLEGAVTENPRAKIRDVNKDIQTRKRDADRQKFAELLSRGGETIRWRVWDDRYHITWDDFQSADPLRKDTLTGSYISTSIGSSWNGEDYVFFAYMNPDRSWCRPGIRSLQSLEYMRMHMAITELFARRIRAMAANQPMSDPNYASEVSKIRREQFAEMRKARDSFAHETQKGDNKEAFLAWHEKIYKALDDLKAWRHNPNPKRMATRKYPVGYFILGQSYDFGAPEFQPSGRLAKKWYKLGINKNNRECMNNMAALMMREAQDDASEQKKAFKLFRRAAEKNLPSAQFNVGIAYWRGLGTEPDHEKALEWFTKSADTNPYSRYALMIMENEEKKKAK